MYVYKTTNLVNGKIYVGQTTFKPEESKNYFGSGVLFLKALKKYGKSNFRKEILRTCKNQKQLDVFEKLYIKSFSSNDLSLGYNILSGTSNEFGSGSPMLIKSVRDKNSESQKRRYEKNPELKENLRKINKGKTYSKDTKEKLSKLKEGEKNPMFGKTHSEASKKKISEANKGRLSGSKNPMYGKTGESAPAYNRKGNKHPMFGKTHSEEARQKISKASKGRKFSEEHKRKISESLRKRNGGNTLTMGT